MGFGLCPFFQEGFLGGLPFFDVRHLSLKWSSCASCNVLLEQQHVARANSVAVGRWLGSMLMFEAFPRLRFVDVCGLISTNCFHKSRSRI